MNNKKCLFSWVLRELSYFFLWLKVSSWWKLFGRGMYIKGVWRLWRNFERRVEDGKMREKLMPKTKSLTGGS
jgi:hypothetical protein